MSFKEGTLSFDSKKIDYIKFGNGKKIMVIIPGVAIKPIKGTGLYASNRYQIFWNDYTVYLIDKVRKLPSDYTTLDIANDYAKAFELLGISNAYVLGLSYGGTISQFLAIEYPELIKKLVLGVSIAYTNNTFEKVISHWLKLAKCNKYGELVVDMIRKSKSDEYIKKHEKVFPLIARFSNHLKLSRFIGLLKTSVTVFPNDRIRFIKCPCLVLGGKQDKVVTPEASIKIADKIKCPIYMYEEYGHSAYNETKDFNRRVLEFFNI